LIFSSYWVVVNDVYAGVGDVLIVKSPGDYVVIRQVPKSRHWIDDAQLRISGYVEHRLCIYGFVLQRDVERIAAELRSGRFALVAMCDPRAVVRPPRREELYGIWRYEGYIVNTSPARMALIRLDPSRRPKFAVDYLRKGCPIYSQHLNQILQLSGIPVQLTC
jgi:signal peptidase I